MAKSHMNMKKDIGTDMDMEMDMNKEMHTDAVMNMDTDMDEILCSLTNYA
jgi:hypothetical protein